MAQLETNDFTESNFVQNQRLNSLAKELNILNNYTKTGVIKVGGGMNDNAAFKDRTRQCNILLKGLPKRVKIHLLNSSNTTGLSGVKASIAATEHLNTSPVPSGGIGAFKPFVFATTTSAVAVGTGDSVVPTSVSSNWLDFTALERTDGGKGYIVMIRCYQDAASSGTQMNIGGITHMTDFTEYQVTCHYAVANGDFTTTATTFNTNANMQPFFLEVEYESKNCSVAIVGDSIMAGSNAGPAATGSSASGAAFKAIKRIYTATGRKITLFNSGWSGAPTTGGSGSTIPSPIRGYYGQFRSYVTSGARPNVAAFCPWSVNNALPYDLGQITAVRTVSISFIKFCVEYGITPLLVTPAPRNGITAEEEDVRRQCVAVIKEVAIQHEVSIVDRDTVYTNYAEITGGYKLPEWCIDNVHPTEAGHVAESYVWEDTLKTIV